MASESKKLFGCPVCGFRVTGKEDACPRCGSKYDENTRFECPFCGEHVQQTATSCPSCHVTYVDFIEKAGAKATDQSIDELLMQIIEMEARQVKKEAKKLSCPKCSWLLDGSEDRCPKCGADFSSDLSYQCPVCGATVLEESATCKECGANFVDEQRRKTSMADLERVAAEQAPADALEEGQGAVMPTREASTPEELPPPVEGGPRADGPKRTKTRKLKTKQKA